MELGIIGLGKMGLNICRRLIQGGHSVVVFDSDSEVLKIAQKENISTGNSLEDLVKKLTKPRILWMMVPSGEITHSTILNLSDLLDRGDIIIDGGNSYYKDTQSMADKLSEKGFEVFIFDLLPSEWIRQDQKFIKGSVLDSGSLSKAINDAKFVYHFAGIADIAESKVSPEKTLELNIMGTTNILKACIENNVERFIFASSMYVYSPYGSFYTASKKCSEIIIETFQDEYDLDYTFLRYGSLYGPRAQDWNGLNSFISQIVKNGELNYFGSGEEKREYIHVTDAADLSLEILSKEYANKAITITGLQVFNSKELIDMIFEIAGQEPKVKMNDRKNTDHYIKTPYRYNVKHARKLTPKSFVDIGQGILEIIESMHDDSHA